MTRYAAEFRSSLKKLLAQADQALYKQKQAGRGSPSRNSPVMFPDTGMDFPSSGFAPPKPP